MCEYCMPLDEEPIIADGELLCGISVGKMYAEYYDAYASSHINYCPMCGRKLTEGDNAKS
mgnify:CR=1 FL=1